MKTGFEKFALTGVALVALDEFYPPLEQQVRMSPPRRAPQP